MQRILIVNDDGSSRAEVRQALESWGYAVEEAADGREAVRVFMSKPIDLAIVDVQIPGRTGLATIAQLSELNEDVPIIAVSPAKPGALDALELGASLQLDKPMAVEELWVAIRWTLGGLST